MQINIDPGVLKECEYMISLHQQYGAPITIDNVPDLIAYILSNVVSGSRRPGSWERSMLDSMGLVADCDEHQTYRANYGLPDSSGG
ncbi:MAG: hypothetical protein V3W04_13775 [Gammaproteobacteria bacterium]